MGEESAITQRDEGREVAHPRGVGHGPREAKFERRTTTLMQV